MIAIIAVLIALLLPAVQAAREAALKRCSMCYQQPRAAWPGLAQLRGGQQLLAGRRAGDSRHATLATLSELLYEFYRLSHDAPLSEQGNVFNATQLQRVLASAAGRVTAGQPMRIPRHFQYQAGDVPLPSNRSQGEFGYRFDFPANLTVPRAAVTDYLFNGRRIPRRRSPITGPLRGPVGFNTATRFAEITDGLSQTFLLGEAAGGSAANPFIAVGGYRGANASACGGGLRWPGRPQACAGALFEYDEPDVSGVRPSPHRFGPEDDRSVGVSSPRRLADTATRGRTTVPTTAEAEHDE